MPDEQSKVTENVQADKAVVAGVINAGVVNVGGTPPTQPLAPRQTPPRNLPPYNEKFVGRKKEIGAIHAALTRQATVGVTQQMAAHGHGGIGKTSVALAYAWTHLAAYPGGVFFLDANTDILLPALVALADKLDVPEAERPEETARRVRERLEGGPPALLILDNVRDGRQWRDPQWSHVLPAGSCRRLITTRAKGLPGVAMYTIERLPTKDGIDLLHKYRPDVRKKGNKAVVGALVEWFDGLAVGLTVAGAYMQFHQDLSWDRLAASLS